MSITMPHHLLDVLEMLNSIEAPMMLRKKLSAMIFILVRIQLVPINPRRIEWMLWCLNWRDKDQSARISIVDVLSRRRRTLLSSTKRIVNLTRNSKSSTARPLHPSKSHLKEVPLCNHQMYIRISPFCVKWSPFCLFFNFFEYHLSKLLSFQRLNF